MTGVSCGGVISTLAAPAERFESTTGPAFAGVPSLTCQRRTPAKVNTQRSLMIVLGG
jgi:hypothetical protein